MGVVIEDHRAPVVTHMVWYRVGSADEPPGQSGIAHFLEHLMFKATDELADGEFSRIVAANGGDDNAFTSPDYTAYFQRIAADRLDLVMGMEADRMTDLAPGAGGGAGRARRGARGAPAGGGERPRRPASASSAGAALYLNHPYRHPVIGWEHEIEASTCEEAMAFYRAHYAPNNAILVVAGDVDPAEVQRLAEAHFGPIPASAAIAAADPPAGAAAGRGAADRDARPAGARALPRPAATPRRSASPATRREAAALTVLAELLGGSGVTSVMARELALGDGIALDAGAYYSDIGVDPQSFSLYVTPKPGVGLAAAEARLDALIARFLAEGPDPAQLARIKARMRAAEIYALDRQQSRARRVGAALATGLTLDGRGGLARAAAGGDARGRAGGGARRSSAPRRR